MSEYFLSTLIAIIRITFWFVILFVLLPRRLFPEASPGPWTRGLFEHVVRMAFASILIVHILAFLHLYDLFSLIASLVAVHLGYLTLVHGVSLRVSVEATRHRLVMLGLNALEGRVHLRQELRGRMRNTAHRLVQGLPRGVDLLWAAVLTTVLVAAGYLRLEDALRNPAPAPPDTYLHLLWTKALGINRLYVDGVYPHGSHALLQVLHRFTVLDEALLLRLAPGLVGVLLVVTIYWAVVRLTGYRGPAIIATALYGIFAFAGWLPLRLDLQGDVLAVDVAMVFLVPTFVFLAEALSRGAEEQGSERAEERGEMYPLSLIHI